MAGFLVIKQPIHFSSVDGKFGLIVYAIVQSMVRKYDLASSATVQPMVGKFGFTVYVDVHSVGGKSGFTEARESDLSIRAKVQSVDYYFCSTA